jgi:hypothetical protein
MFSMFCLMVFVSDPIPAAKNVIIRLGLYGGVILALQFTAIQSISLLRSDKSIPAVVAVAAGIGAAGAVLVAAVVRRLIVDHVRLRSRYAAGIGMAVVVWIVMAVVWPQLLAPLVIIPLALVATAPSLALASYTWAAFEALKLSRGNGTSFERMILGSSSWLIAYLIACDLCARQVIHQYAQLPNSPPSCYIATAAAKGHPKLVGSEPCNCGGSVVFRVNDQLRYLKAGELVIRRFAPNFHTAIRAVYDRVGPALARQLTCPLFADLTYVSLKPIEWMARGAMRCLLPQALVAARILYRM